MTDVAKLLRGSLDSWRTVLATGRYWSRPAQRLTEGLEWCWRLQGVGVDPYDLEQDLSRLSPVETTRELWAEQERQTLRPFVVQVATPGS